MSKSCEPRESSVLFLLSPSEATKDLVTFLSPLMEAVEQMEGGRGMDGIPRGEEGNEEHMAGSLATYFPILLTQSCCILKYSPGIYLLPSLIGMFELCTTCMAIFTLYTTIPLKLGHQ